MAWGSAAVQLAKRRGATVIALCSPAKADEFRPHVAKVFPLHESGMAQEEFLSKKHMGKIVLTMSEADF